MLALLKRTIATKCRKFTFKISNYDQAKRFSILFCFAKIFNFKILNLHVLVADIFSNVKSNAIFW